MRRTVTFLMATAMAACGSAAGEGYAPPYLTLHGTITTTGAVTTPSTVRVALVWKLDAQSGASASSSFRAVQELDVRAEFPVSFSIDVRALPPVEAMRQAGKGAPLPGIANAYAIGTLVVYEDANRNGKLDLLPADAPASGDRILGAPTGLEIIYLEGGGIPKNPDALPGDEDVLDHDPGFNLIFEPAREPIEPGCTACGGPVGPWTKLPLRGDLQIALTADPRLARALCADTGYVSASAQSGCQPCIGDACASCAIPSGAAVRCSADKTAFVVSTCASSSVCAALTCETVSGRRDAGLPAPAGWPCP
jgi:hypothetical protein